MPAQKSPLIPTPQFPPLSSQNLFSGSPSTTPCSGAQASGSLLLCYSHWILPWFRPYVPCTTHLPTQVLLPPIPSLCNIHLPGGCDPVPGPVWGTSVAAGSPTCLLPSLMGHLLPTPQAAGPSEEPTLPSAFQQISVCPRMGPKCFLLFCTMASS